MDRTILVVDDDEGMARTLADILELKGWTADTASSGEEAVAAVERRGYRLVLMDIRMSGMNGVDALHAVRRRRPETRVILMTAYSTAELIEEAVQAGAIDVLSKPVAPQRLMSLVEQASIARGPILVVDDDADYLETLCQSLRSNGIQTHAASSLADALASLESTSAVDVVALDLKLDDVSGTDSIIAIREASPSALFILFTGYPDMLDAVTESVPDSWVVASLLKPFDPTRLAQILEDVHGP